MQPLDQKEKSLDDMKSVIAYKGIVHNVLKDAPFIGAILIANACHYGCKDCINEHLKDPLYYKEETPDEIIEKVLENKLNQGVIFSGLEWSEQPEDLKKLVKLSLARGLKVMVYTHHTEESFFKILPELKELPIYIKFGMYDEKLKTSTNFCYGVQLATSNQVIKYYGKDA